MDQEKLRTEFKEKLKAALDRKSLEEVRVEYLGRKGMVAELMKRIGQVPKKARPKYGQEVNEFKKFLESEISKKQKELLGGNKNSKSDTFDVTEPGVYYPAGSFHPITTVGNEMLDIFVRLGFRVVEGPEIETDWYNFEALNIAPDHPARDTQDTFYVDRGELLRTHTSPVQIKVMETEKPPIRVVVPGRVYRRDLDPTHTPMFNQIEGLLVDETTNFAELKGTLTYFVHQFFGPDTKLRFRPHHFPFTEPSAEVDISCTICHAKGEVGGSICRVCKGTKWLEILGAGMVHPNVLKNGGINPKKYRGFAFGIGIDRPAMLKLGIPDLRLLFDNDVRFLEQF